jgi:hypothetical protein
MRLMRHGKEKSQNRICLNHAPLIYSALRFKVNTENKSLNRYDLRVFSPIFGIDDEINTGNVK